MRQIEVIPTFQIYESLSLALPKPYELFRLNLLLEIHIAQKGLENRLRKFDTIWISTSALNNELKISGTTPPPPTPPY